MIDESTKYQFSTTGSAIELPAKMSQALKARGFEIAAGFNADRAGDLMSERLAQASGVSMRRERPPSADGKDWNDALRQRNRELWHSGAAAMRPDDSTRLR